MVQLRVSLDELSANLRKGIDSDILDEKTGGLLDDISLQIREISFDIAVRLIKENKDIIFENKQEKEDLLAEMKDEIYETVAEHVRNLV